MKKLLFVALIFLFALSAFAQTQKGYVKTKGRLDSEGNLIPGTPLSEVVVKVKDRNEVMSDKRGDFSFPMPDQTYYLESVAKNGYVLIDPDLLSKQYSYSKNKLVIALETKDQQIEERMENFAKINAAQNEMIRKLRAEVKQLKEENKITEEEYGRRLQEIADMQMESQQLVEEMVERYTKIDYDQMNEFDRQIKVYILNGELVKAKKLVKSKGDLAERAENLKKINEANAKEREELTKRNKKLEKSEALALKERDDLANDYYNLFEIYKMEHKNDSAAYYLELRAALDTTNVEWLSDCGTFVEDYIADYDQAMKILKKALLISIKNNGECNGKTVLLYTKIGNLYYQMCNYEKAIEYTQMAYEINNCGYKDNVVWWSNIYNNFGLVNNKQGNYNIAIDYYKKAISNCMDSVDLTALYNNMGIAYHNIYDVEKAMECYKKSELISIKLFGNNTPDLATTYANISSLNIDISNYDTAWVYVNKALQLYKIFYSTNHPYIAGTYSRMGIICNKKGAYEQALNCYWNSLEIYEDCFGGNHEMVASDYINISKVYYAMNELSEAKYYLIKAMNILESYKMPVFKKLITCYKDIGDIYVDEGDLDNALLYLQKAMVLVKKIEIDDGYMKGNLYNSIGFLYFYKKDYDNAIKCFKEALIISEHLFGKNHMDVAAAYHNLGYVLSIKGDDNDALYYLDEALQIRTAIVDPNNPQIADSYLCIGNVYVSEKKYNLALENYNKALIIRENIYGIKDTRTIKVKAKISEVQQKLKESPKK